MDESDPTPGKAPLITTSETAQAPGSSFDSALGTSATGSTHNSTSEPDMTEDYGSDQDTSDTFRRTSATRKDSVLADSSFSINPNSGGEQDAESNDSKVHPATGKTPTVLNDIDLINFADEFPKRQLRPQSNIKRAFTTTWIDTDKTDNYDPIEDERQQRLKRRRVAKPRRPARETDEDSSEHEPSRPPLVAPKLITVLHFTAGTGTHRFTNLVTGLEAADQAETSGYKLRTRAKESHRSRDCRTEDHTKSSHEEIDLRAKPFARGCWGCVHLTGKDEATCSLVHDEREWPCQMCVEDDHDCELIIPPVQKRACEFCKRRKIQCSYRTTRNHGESCKQCSDIGYRCIAGPVKDSIRQRIRLDRDWELDPLPRKKGKGPAPRDCLECRKVGGPCTYPVGVEGAPCIDCKWANLPCTIDGDENDITAGADSFDFDAFVNQKAKATKQPVADSYEVTSRRTDHYNNTTKRTDPTSTTTKPTHQKPQGKFTTITTNFSHPIHFNCDEEDSKHPETCHFCTCPSLAFVGFGSKTDVEVIAWDDNTDFTETANGHQADGLESTRICSICTTSRLMVLTCNRHEMRPIPGVDVSDETKEKAIEALFENSLEDAGVFCGLCTGLAGYECVAAGEEGSEGCGLKLCETCALTLEGQSDGDLKGLLKKFEKGQLEEPEDGLRADAELLKGKGSLMRYLRRITME